MFDPVTAELLKAAPGLPDLNPETLPQTLTRQYAELVTRRLRAVEGAQPEARGRSGEWPLSRIADAYELVTSIHRDPAVKRAAAFVAATAHQILAQERLGSGGRVEGSFVTRDGLNPDVAASLLFLAAKQYADANEAARRIEFASPENGTLDTLLAEDLIGLAVGDLEGILERARSRQSASGVDLSADLETRGLMALLEAILVGIEMFAAEVLDERLPRSARYVFDSARAVFARVLELSSHRHASTGLDPVPLLTTYPGPRHLAALLLAAYDATASDAATKINVPPGVDNVFWKRWLRQRAMTAPFLWRNHLDAVRQGFHNPGTSAVMVLPTGAGKTTVSCLKIASTLASSKNVVFVAPTHALVEQLTADLQAVFPEELLGSLVSSDFDRLFASGTSLRRIEVMTPEHCLALLSYAPESFDEVGLMVFDECHLLSPSSGLRRALDGMFCVLAFSSIAPDADFLFLSAMIRNGEEFARWIGTLTDRNCIFIDALWKPSRQARGVVFYQKDTINQIQQAAVEAQRAGDDASGTPARTLRVAARNRLLAEPFALFGLRYDWLNLRDRTADIAINKISDSPVTLAGAPRRDGVSLKPNVNGVAAHIAAAAARNGLKVIVFVNVKSHAVKAARDIAAQIGDVPVSTPDEDERWQALEAELGGLQYSLLSGPSSAVPHNSQMIRLERDLAERMFRRPGGAQVIVATPTLAQGLNLPAHMAVLASDMRADEEGGRESLEAHEILNAAARAGRAGHLANGLVLLIPEAILTFERGQPLSGEVVQRLRSVLPEDDRCIDLADPLQTVLDRISGGVVGDPDVEYALNRLSTAVQMAGDASAVETRFSLRKSFAAFLSARRADSDRFEQQISQLNEVLQQRNTGSEERVFLELAAQSGTPVAVLQSLRQRLEARVSALPQSIPDWVNWIFEWLSDDQYSFDTLFGRERTAVMKATGRRTTEALSFQVLSELLPGVMAWLRGQPLCEIELALGGDPEAAPGCPRARALMTTVIPMTLVFIAGVVGRSAREIPAVAAGIATPAVALDSLHACVRRGFDTPFKLAFAESTHLRLLSRVQVHRAYNLEVAANMQQRNLREFSDYRELVAVMREVLFDI